MVGKPLALEEFEVARLVEADLAAAAEAKPAGRPDRLDDRVGRVRVHPVGPLAGQAEQDGAVGGVALAGQGERAVELRQDPFGALQHRFLRQRLDKAARGRHRPHRVRARGADPDLEEVEDAGDQASLS